MNLKVPIFSSFGRSASSQMAKISYEQSKTKLETLEKQIKVTLKNAKANYELGLDDFYTTKSNMKLAESIERKNKIKFSQGIVSSFDLRQAQTQLYAAQNKYLNALKNLASKKIEFETLLNITNK